MFHTISIWLLILAFFGAGVFNEIGTASTRRDFVRWGYPAWWRLVTGGLEVATAVLIAVPATRLAGLILGALVIVAAIVTVIRHRDFAHLAPLGVFAALLFAAAVTR